MFGFTFKDKYQSYKAAVLKKVAKSLTITAGMQHAVELWIRDFFIDGFSVDDCAGAIKDNIHESLKRKEANQLLEAKRILRQNGYKLIKK